VSWRLATALVRLASRVMPASRRAWADAMIAETAFLPTGVVALRYCAGCVLAAVRLRMAAEFRHMRPQAAAGSLGGLLFALNAMIPESRSWPWLWPAVAGILVAVGPARFRAAAGLYQCMKAGLAAGFIAGAIFFVGCALVVIGGRWIAGGPPLERSLPLLLYGAGGALLVSTGSAALAYSVNRIVWGRTGRS
jgi:hypothetical protein